MAEKQPDPPQLVPKSDRAKEYHGQVYLPGVAKELREMRERPVTVCVS
jgi:hypothetical protein